MEGKLLFETTLTSVVHNNEIAAELVRIAKEQNLPVQKAKFYKPLEKYAGFARDYIIAAQKRPPLPGGWIVRIEGFEPEERVFMVNVEREDTRDRKAGELRDLMLRMFDEYRKEGLEITVVDGIKEFYGNPVREVKASGHPIILEMLEDFVENLR